MSDIHIVACWRCGRAIAEWAASSLGSCQDIATCKKIAYDEKMRRLKGISNVDKIPANGVSRDAEHRRHD